jgi:beta-alanine degradation protein BauB
LKKNDTLLKCAAILLSIAGGRPLYAQDASKVQPSTYRVVQDNASVRVLEYTSRPGMGVCGSGTHSHPAHLTILLTPARVRVKENGKTFITENKVGDSFWSGPVTHEVENVGGASVRLLIVEIKSPGRGR